MKRALLPVLVLASAVAFAQGTPSKKSGGGKPAAPTKPAPAKSDAPDVERMPFTPDSIRQVVAYNQGRIQECYEDHMAEKDKKVEGKLHTSFTIDANGLVKNAKVKKGSTLKDPNLHDCVVAVLTSMTFPKPPDGADHPIEYPFNLKAVE
ncbi:AgmX/PglI C-terminal domain-containing protein [Myxococcus sp. K38C18041901]|uniref:AgmX/PglI C-terminal domain-containing protein n=1 Tax=Myxococcus guangdongensis TaxID=2906760 RepID=UPI0020A83214|nr:AgmX/PglI C-terminal domain-containing protein [Myxococcus guangdongensis]MCP3061679.1 AgmX/PglI C-terminal domain-containing protein [Myxococcus guangdongensis]